MAGKNKAEASSEVRLGIPADFRIADVTDMHRQLGDVLDVAQIMLDGSAVDRIDTAALQLLVVFQREVRQRGNQLNWAGVSAPLHDAASQLGLAQALELPAKQPA